MKEASDAWVVSTLAARMGKRSRNRKKQENAAVRASGVTGSEDLVEQLLGVRDVAGFVALVESRPELLGEIVAAHLDDLQGTPGIGPTFCPHCLLVREAREDPARAWHAFELRIAELEERWTELDSQVELVAAALEARRPDDAITLAQEALPKAIAAGHGYAIGILRCQGAKALLQTRTGDRAQNIEESIAGFNEAVPVTFDPEHAADLLMHLGIAYGQRIRGDRAENLETAMVALREGLEGLEESSAPETWAILRHNLAELLLRRERGDRAANLRQAAELCHLALAYRSPERGGYDWAHTQVTLGAVLEELSILGEVDMAEAERAYERVIDERQRLPEAWLVGAAHYALGRRSRLTTVRSAEDLVKDFEEGRAEEPPATRSFLEAAARHLVIARSLLHDAPDRIYLGRALRELADVLAELGRPDEAIEVGQEALAILRPTSAPRECADAAGRLGGLLAERGEWDDAASAYRLAVKSAELSFHGRLDTASREDEARRTGNLARWAAFAIARAGDAPEAALVLENGRTRELRRRFGVDARLGELPAELRHAYTTAVGSLAASPLGPQGAGAARRLQEVLSMARTIPGLEDFATGARLEDLLAAVEPEWPLLYVNPTPVGTLLLIISSEGAGHSLKAHFLDRPTSLDIFSRLTVGDVAESSDDAELHVQGSYLFGIGGAGESERALSTDVGHALPWLGKHLAHPVRNILAGAGGHGATLICCGPLGVAPVHAAPWRENGQDRCLVDEFDIRYAGSAILAATALERAASRAAAEPTLVAVSNPNGNLPAAGAEVEEIARHFDPHRISRVDGRQATSHFLQSAAAEASHLHLACHANGGLFDATEAAIRLADGPVSALKLTGLSGLQARLAVVSACQSAVSEIAAAPDEVFSIGTAMLAAGSACAIASLWSVDDGPTALLMTRLYDEMFSRNRRPPEALRRAQLWLRDLTRACEAQFLEGHPALEAEFRRRSALGERPGHRGTDARMATGEERPYAHPVFWAPFIAVGA